MFFHGARRPRLVLAHEAGIADDVYGHDRGEFAGFSHYAPQAIPSLAQVDAGRTSPLGRFLPFSGQSGREAATGQSMLSNSTSRPWSNPKACSPAPGRFDRVGSGKSPRVLSIRVRPRSMPIATREARSPAMGSARTILHVILAPRSPFAVQMRLTMRNFYFLRYHLTAN